MVVDCLFTLVACLLFVYRRLFVCYVLFVSACVRCLWVVCGLLRVVVCLLFVGCRLSVVRCDLFVVGWFVVAVVATYAVVVAAVVRHLSWAGNVRVCCCLLLHGVSWYLLFVVLGLCCLCFVV